MLHVLITGGAGFVGSHLTDRLLREGHSITVIDDLSTGSLTNLAHLQPNPRLRVVIDDIRHALVMDRLANECDVVVHLAAAVGVQRIVDHPLQTIRINIGGAEAVFEAAARYRRKVLLASTSEVYGKGISIPFREEDDTVMGPTIRSRWSYAATKAIDEFLALAYHKEMGLPVVIFRLFNTVGPRQSGQYGMVLPRFVRWALAGEPIRVYGDGQQTRCFGNVGDVTDAIARLLTSEAAIGQVYNIGSQEEISMLALAERVRERAYSRSEIQFVPYEAVYADGFEDFRRRVPAISKIEAATGWKPSTSLNETIDQIIHSFREKRTHGGDQP